MVRYFPFIITFFVFGCSSNQKENRSKHTVIDSTLAARKIHCQDDNPAVFKADLEDGYRMQIVGSNFDMVQFYFRDEAIGLDPIKDGDCLNLDKQKHSRINENLRINHVQFGTTRERGNFYCYAVIDKTVYRSPVWTETIPGNEAYMELVWEGLKGNIYKGRLQARRIIATFSFDPTTNEWNCEPGTEGIKRGITIKLKY